MPQVQEEIIVALGKDALSMAELFKRMDVPSGHSMKMIRAAVLPLISTRLVELTLERKLRVAGA